MERDTKQKSEGVCVDSAPGYSYCNFCEVLPLDRREEKEIRKTGLCDDCSTEAILCGWTPKVEKLQQALARLKNSKRADLILIKRDSVEDPYPED